MEKTPGKMLYTFAELRAIECYLKTNNMAKSYLAAHPETEIDLNDKTAKLTLQKKASRFFGSIRAKAGNDANFLMFLEACNLGNFRLGAEMSARLQAVKYRQRGVQKERIGDDGKTEIYTEVETIAEPDESVRMQATGLLAELLGKKKNVIQIEEETENPIVEELRALRENMKNATEQQTG